MDRSPQRTEKNKNFGMKCIKYMLIIINALYLIISFLMISGATTLKVIFGEYYFVLWSSNSIDSLSSLWIATGCFLLALSIFGIAAAVKESTMLTNIYGIVLSFIFILQMAAAITGFTLITQSSGIVHQSLNYLMRDFQYNYEFRDTMNWVQKTFQCCGNDGPSDWNDFAQFRPTTVPWWETTEQYPYPTTVYDYYHSTAYPTTANDDYYYTTATAYETTTNVSPPQLDRMPQSCCTRGSSYANMVCESHFTRGCHAPLHAIVSESVLMIGSSALVIGVVQILGIICAFMLARVIRRSKTNRDIQRWAIHQSMGFDRPAYVDQVPNPATGTEEVKHI